MGCTPLRMRRVRIFFLGGAAFASSVVVTASANSFVDAPYCRVMDERSVGAKARHGREYRLAIIVTTIGDTFIWLLL